MLNCLHLINRYLGISETFIWNYLQVADRFSPIILAGGYENLNTFPLAKGTLLSSHPQRPLLPALKAKFKGTYAEDDYTGCMADLESHPADIIHAHYGYRAIVSRTLVQKLEKPLVTSFYGFDLSHRAFLKRAAGCYDNLFEEGSAFLVEGTSMRNRLHKLGCPWDKIHIQKIALRLSRYNFRERNLISGQPVKFLFIGRLVPKKGLDVGLKALSKAKAMGKDWKLTIVGDGPMKKKWFALSKKLGISQKTEFCGNIPPEHLPDVYDTHDILLQPSCTAEDGDGEGGAPTVLLEAQACGMPILSTLHDDIPNVVREKENALLSEERNVEELAENIQKMMDAHDKWPVMGRIGRAYMAAHHDVQKAVIQLEKLYFAILS